MTKARSTADVSDKVDALESVTFSANNIGDVFGLGYNLNNNVFERVWTVPMPAGRVPVSISTTGTFNLPTVVGGDSQLVSAIILQTDGADGVANVEFTAPLTNTADPRKIVANSADASITFNF